MEESPVAQYDRHSKGMVITLAALCSAVIAGCGVEGYVFAVKRVGALLV